jgi:hypothetical protein
VAKCWRAQPPQTSDAPVDDLIDAHGEGRFHARRSLQDVLEVKFAALKAHHVVSSPRED